MPVARSYGRLEAEEQQELLEAEAEVAAEQARLEAIAVKKLVEERAAREEAKRAKSMSVQEKEEDPYLHPALLLPSPSFTLTLTLLSI